MSNAGHIYALFALNADDESDDPAVHYWRESNPEEFDEWPSFSSFLLVDMQAHADPLPESSG